MITARLRLFPLAVLVLPACTSDTTGAGDVLVVSQIDIQPPGAGLVIGTTQQFTATPKTSSGIPVPNRTVTWSSSDEAVASISTNGLVTAVSLGHAEISARVDQVTASRPVNVTPKPVATVQVAPSSPSILVGLTVQLQVTLRDADGQILTDRSISFVSDNPQIATVSEAGLVSGVAAGQTIVRAQSEGKEGTANVTVTPRPATQLGFTIQPANGTAGQALATMTVALLDALGGTVTNATNAVTLALESNPGGSTLGGTLTVNAVAGVATFSTVVLNKVGSGYTLLASTGALTPATSNPFAIAAGPAAQLAITTAPPAVAQNGAPLNPQPVVQVQDGSGNPIMVAGKTVTAAFATTPGGSPALANASATTDASGNAKFSGLTLTGPPGNYTLRFESTGLTSATSSAIRLSAGVPARIDILTQPPTSAQNGQPFSSSPVVAVLDADGFGVGDVAVTVALATGSGSGTLGGTLTMTTGDNGQATFPGLSLAGPIGNYTLVFTAGSLASPASRTIALTAGPAAKLGITTQPSATVRNDQVFPTQPVIQVQDLGGNPSSTSGITVTASIASGGGTLSGGTAVTNGSGAAEFTGLKITGAAGPHTLQFSAPGLTGTTSNPVTVVAGVATQIVIVTQPPATIPSGQTLVPNPVVDLRDMSGNNVDSAGVVITASKASGSGTLEGTLNATTGANGQATFTNLRFSGSSGNKTIAFNRSGLQGAVSNTIAVTSPPSELIIVTQPSSSARSGVPLARVPVIRVRDAQKDPVAGITVNVTLLDSGSLSGTVSGLSNANGDVTFTGLTISGPIGNKTLRFSTPSPGVPAETANDVALSAGPASQIGINTQPGSPASYGVNFSPQPVVQLRDSEGNPVDSSGATITAVLVESSGTLNGTKTLTTNSSGRVSFSGLDITGTIPGPYHIRFDANNLPSAVSAAITLLAGPPEDLTIITQPPASIGSGATFAPAVQVLDVGGNPVAGIAVTVAIQAGGGTLSGTTTRTTDGSGIATFTGLALNATAGGGHSLRFEAGGLTRISDSFTVTAGAPVTLKIVTQPSSAATSGEAFSRHPEVELRDSGNNLVSGFDVTAVLEPGFLSSGSLIGTNPVATVGGVARFETLGIKRDVGSLGSSFRIRFEAGGLSATSSSITVNF